MARYTTTVYDLKKNNFDFGLKDYPIFDESYREVLNEKLLSHYLFHEIGQETPMMFRHYLNCAMNEIMPLMIKRYESTLKEYDIFGNIDITETFTTQRKEENKQDMTGSNSSQGNTTNTAHDETATTTESNGTSDTEFTGMTAKSDVGNQNITLKDATSSGYMSEVDYTENTDSNTNTSKATGSSTSDATNNSNSTMTSTSINSATGDRLMVEDYTRVTKGSSAGLSFSKALEQYREILIDVDMEIIEHEKIQSCFMMVF